MNVRYDHDIDAIYFNLTDSPSYDSEEIKDGIIIDYDRHDNIVGIEILNFSRQKQNGLTINDLPFPSDKLNIINQYFNIPVLV